MMLRVLLNYFNLLTDLDLKQITVTKLIEDIKQGKDLYLLR